jgi:probable HAF family extracellular repeat protein
LCSGSGECPSYGNGLNDLQQVVGYSLTDTTSSGGTHPYHPYHAFLYENGAMKDLGVLAQSSFEPGELPYSRAYDINDWGQVVGWSTTDEYYTIEFPPVCEEWGPIIFDPDSDTGFTQECLRWSEPEVQNVYVSHAFLYEDGVMKDLGSVGGGNSSAQAINDAGHVVGSWFEADTDGDDQDVRYPNPFLYKDGDMQDLGIGRGIAYDINESDAVVGQLFDEGYPAQGGSHAFLYENGSRKSLGLPEGTGYDSYAIGINDSGQVVGNSNDGPFLYEDDTLKNLNDLIPSDSPWQILNATDINEEGQITAVVWNPSWGVGELWRTLNTYRLSGFIHGR